MALSVVPFAVSFACLRDDIVAASGVMPRENIHPRPPACPACYSAVHSFRRSYPLPFFYIFALESPLNLDGPSLNIGRGDAFVAR